MRHGENSASSLPKAPSGFWPSVWFVVRIAPRMPFVWFMRFYRKFVSPTYPDVCKYYPSCSKYALDAFEVKGAVRGTLMTVWRVLRCNPFSSGGVDHVEGSVMERRSRLIHAQQSGWQNSAQHSLNSQPITDPGSHLGSRRN